MKLVVCDDEPLARERLVRIVKRAGHEVAATATTGIEALQAVKQHSPDVILLDIRMPQMDGVQCANELSKLDYPPAVIFVTAYDQYAIAAFKTHAIGYLLKAVDPDELLTALDNATHLNAAQLNGIQDLNDPDAPHARKHISARTHRGVELIALHDVFFFTADQKYVQVRHKGGSVLIDETLKDLEKEFEHSLFRIHRNALINLSYLERLETVGTGQYQVSFKGIDEKLAVSRRHVPILRDKIKNM